MIILKFYIDIDSCCYFLSNSVYTIFLNTVRVMMDDIFVFASYLKVLKEAVIVI